MRQVREVLRLKYLCGQSGHRIAAAIGISRYTVAEYLRRAAVVGITWPVPPELDDTALERKLFTPPGAMAAETMRPQPDWARLHAEMRRPGVTLLLLWEEYRAGQPEGYGSSRYVAAVPYVAAGGESQGYRGEPWLDPQHRNCLQRLSGTPPPMRAGNVRALAALSVRCRSTLASWAWISVRLLRRCASYPARRGQAMHGSY